MTSYLYQLIRKHICLRNFLFLYSYDLLIFGIGEGTVSLDVVRDLFHFLHHLRWSYGSKITVFGHTLRQEVFVQRVRVNYYGCSLIGMQVEWLLVVVWKLVAIAWSLFLAILTLDNLLSHICEARLGLKTLVVHFASWEAPLLAWVTFLTPIEMVEILLRSNILADFVIWSFI